MALDELGVGLLAIVARIVFYIFVEVLFEIVLHGVGWLTLKVFTLGRYPKRDTSDTMISAIGTVTLIGGILIVVAIAKLS